MSPWDEHSVLRGSPLYMAPEMVCHRQYDSRVDLWSVGVILYGECLLLLLVRWPSVQLTIPQCVPTEALFGRAPFASKSYAELEEKIRSNQSIEVRSNN